MEDYKEKYEKALERAMSMHDQGTMPERIEFIFPELRESEDERIRKDLIQHLEILRGWTPGDPSPIKVKEHYDAWLSWLKNQDNPSGDAIITIYDGPEAIEGVRVQALGEDFVISLHDAENGKDNFTYDEAMQWLKDHETQTFNRKQANIICIYLDEINDKLDEAGGERFAGDWYITNELYIPRGSSADYTALRSWFFDGTHGCLDDGNRYDANFRCRPSLALPLPA